MSSYRLYYGFVSGCTFHWLWIFSSHVLSWNILLLDLWVSNNKGFGHIFLQLIPTKVGRIKLFWFGFPWRWTILSGSGLLLISPSQRSWMWSQIVLLPNMSSMLFNISGRLMKLIILVYPRIELILKRNWLRFQYGSLITNTWFGGNGWSGPGYPECTTWICLEFSSLHYWFLVLINLFNVFFPTSVV